MMRVGTILTLSLAVAAGIGLFYAKHRVQALEAELSGLQQQILRDREAIHVLKAEWSFLNDPDRLAELARRHLEMAPVSGSQLATIDDVPEKLPQVEAPGETPGTDGEPPAERPSSDAQIVAAPEAAPLPAEPAPAAPAAAQPEPSPFADLPPDVQAVLASMRTPE
jgi:cell division protein FtsL